MADCKVAKITENLINALDGQSITINEIATLMIAEGQRSVYDSRGEVVYTEVCGPWPETLASDSVEKHVSLHYVIECHINGLNDAAPADPVTVQTKNTGADLSKIITTDNTRGGNALITRIFGEPYYYFSGSPQSPEYIVRIDVEVEVFLNINDTYQ